ncbi:MAG TPA: DNA internalization-related competence protein ComEC/Rec2 [Longimicrobiales bacterium]|nr:DNA internalization-related competence protein ComEC/Rec2 [Longimicrobiales bacterium]
MTGTVESKADEQHRTITLHPDGCRQRIRVYLTEHETARLGDHVTITGEAAAGMVFAHSLDRSIARPPHRLLAYRGAVQARIRAVFPNQYPLAEALLVAQREAIAPEVKAAFAASGLTHLLAISGSHVALVAAMIMSLLSLLRASRRINIGSSLAGATIYVLFLGAPFAALRSIVQMAMLALSRARQQPAHPLGLLATAAIVITAIDPAAPLDAGFQLSFAGIFGIIMWRRPLIELMPRVIPSSLRDAIATTLSASAITTPIAAYHFGVVSVIALVANLAAAPVIAVAVPAAVVVLLLSLISMSLARMLAPGAELALGYLQQIAERCAAIPYGHFAITPLATFTATLTAGLAFYLMRGSYRSTVRGRVAIASTASLAAIALIAPIARIAQAPLEIHMIDVGQGDALAIRSPRGRWLLVDAGPASQKMDAGKRNVVPFLLRHNAHRVEAIVLSHPHLDHYGGVRAVLNAMGVGVIIDPTIPTGSVEFAKLLSIAERNHTPWLQAREHRTIEMDGMRIEFLAPDSIGVVGADAANDYSATFRLSYGKFTALFMGDTSCRGEEELLKNEQAALDVDLLKVGHHGSGTSSCAPFLEAVTPHLALISVGRKNRYHHPHPATLARLEGIGARVFRSDEVGSVSVKVTRNGRIAVSTSQ